MKIELSDRVEEEIVKSARTSRFLVGCVFWVFFFFLILLGLFLLITFTGGAQ